MRSILRGLLFSAIVIGAGIGISGCGPVNSNGEPAYIIRYKTLEGTIRTVKTDTCIDGGAYVRFQDPETGKMMTIGIANAEVTWNW